MATYPLHKVKCTINLADTFFDQVVYGRVCTDRYNDFATYRYDRWEEFVQSLFIKLPDLVDITSYEMFEKRVHCLMYVWKSFKSLQRSQLRIVRDITKESESYIPIYQGFIIFQLVSAITIAYHIHNNEYLIY